MNIIFLISAAITSTPPVLQLLRKIKPKPIPEITPPTIAHNIGSDNGG